LILSKGARQVSPDELAAVKPPPSEGRWHPVAHHRVLAVVTQTLIEAGYAVERTRLGVSPDGHRFFGTLDLTAEVVHGVQLAVGIRNSTDRQIALGFCAGNRVVVCSNMAFRSDLLVKRKHTINGERNFVSAIAGRSVRSPPSRPTRPRGFGASP
jgi:hypothetical protein